MCKLDGTGPGLDLVMVSGCEPLRLGLLDFTVIRVIKSMNDIVCIVCIEDKKANRILVICFEDRILGRKVLKWI